MIFQKRQQEDTTWLSVSDLMTVLMAIFLIIAVLVSTKYKIENETIKKTMDEIKQQEKELCDQLSEIFKKVEIPKKRPKDLNQAARPQDLNKGEFFIPDALKIQCDPIKITFGHDDMTFGVGKWDLKENFQGILEIFWPIYIDTVKSSEVSQYIDEIRIEGHTDPVPVKDKHPFLSNINLSQQRSREVLKFVYTLEENKVKANKMGKKDLAWIEKRLTANGLSYSRPLRGEECEIEIDLDQSYDDPVRYDLDSKRCSRRVEIVLRTNSINVFKILTEEIKLDE